MTIRDIQRALAAKGYVVGAIDGVWGPQTRAALARFQRDQGITVDGIVGPQSLGRLFPDAPAPAQDLGNPIPVWFHEARRLIGTREQPGRGSNPEILDWASDVSLVYSGDDIPWCGLFVSHCISATLADEPVPAHLLSARAWERFGVRTKPTLGAVMVFWRESIASGLGHVGFYAGEDDTAYRILGGNQSDSVSLAWKPKDRCVAARWPATVAAPDARPLVVARDDGLDGAEA